MTRAILRPAPLAAATLVLCISGTALDAQQTLGAISGTIADPTNAVLSGATFVLVDDQTAAARSETANVRGGFSFQALPIGSYHLTVSAPGFAQQDLPGITVQADRTATLNITLTTGAVSSGVEVNATPQLDATDPTNGYVLDSATIEKTPLGTSSFTQFATLSPGVHADPLADTGTNTGLGNQNIYANGQRLSSNTFTFNSVLATISSTAPPRRRWRRVVPCSTPVSPFSQTAPSAPTPLSSTPSVKPFPPRRSRPSPRNA